MLKNPQIENIIENDYVDNIKQCIHREHRNRIPSIPKNLVELIEAMNNVPFMSYVFFFYQLFTIHVNGHYVPLFFFFITYLTKQ